MEKVHRKAFSIKRTMKISKTTYKNFNTVFLIVVFFANINLINCYSNVRRSGSISISNEEKPIVEKLKPNISPMLRPIIESKEINIDTLKVSHNETEENFDKKDVQYEEFKPLPLGGNFKIPIVEKSKTDVNKNKKNEIFKQLDATIDLIQNSDKDPIKKKRLSALEEDILTYVDDTLSQDHFKLFEGIEIEPVNSLKARDLTTSFAGAPRSFNTNASQNGNDNFDHKIMKRFTEFVKTHKITVNIPETARFFGFKYLSSLWRKAGRYAKRWLRSNTSWFGGKKTKRPRSLSDMWTSRAVQPQKTWSQVTYSGPNNYVWPQNSQWPYYSGKNMWPVGNNYGGIAWPTVTKIWPNVPSINIESTTTPPTEIKRTSSTLVGNGLTSFLTGFGMGFLAFGLKKLLLPIFIGAQIVKSVLIAMFLPSILGSFGKIIGKGLSQFSGASTNFGHNEVQAGEELDYKDMGYTDQEQDTGYHYPNGGDTVGTLPAHTLYGDSSNNLANVAMSRYGPGGTKVTYVPSASNNFYTKVPFKKQEDFKVFHNIPSSSLLLSNYDPFYSPLLSRLDSVFQRLGLKGGTAGSQGAPASVERCREKLVCLMYASPAKYAPYSNLVSAQLSRELNELRRPTSDNQEILRFFKYMKAAKNGQEGLSCNKIYPGCPSLTSETGSAAMITTYNDINKLVGARKLEK